MDNSIKIMGEEIERICFNCGEEINPEHGDQFLVCFEPGENNYPKEPDIMPCYYLICENCIKEWIDYER